jgi:hypothetical protein
MTSSLTGNQCKGHYRVRRLEVHDGVECVVQLCVDCGRRELCWSRRPLSPEIVTAHRAGGNERAAGVRIRVASH